MRFQIRLATLEDVEGIVSVKQSVWGATGANLDLMRRIVVDGGHRTLVAEVEGNIAGFVDGFQTVSAAAMKRWELDLIAVRPEFQKQGIAAELMRMNTAYGRESGSLMARGLVEIENVGSQRTFTRCGYSTDGVICGLFVLEKGDIGAEIDDYAFEESGTENLKSVIEVSTLSYSGVWLEDEWTDTELRIVNKQLRDRQYDLAGCVIPNTNFQAIEAAKRAGFTLVGQYQWWKLNFTKNDSPEIG